MYFIIVVPTFTSIQYNAQVQTLFFIKRESVKLVMMIGDLCGGGAGKEGRDNTVLPSSGWT